MMTIAIVFSFLDRGILALLVGPIKADLGISDTQMSLLLGFAFASFYAVMGIPFGIMVDRVNRVRLDLGRLLPVDDRDRGVGAHPLLLEPLPDAHERRHRRSDGGAGGAVRDRRLGAEGPAGDRVQHLRHRRLHRRRPRHRARRRDRRASPPDRATSTLPLVGLVHALAVRVHPGGSAGPGAPRAPDRTPCASRRARAPPPIGRPRSARWWRTTGGTGARSSCTISPSPRSRSRATASARGCPRSWCAASAGRSPGRFLARNQRRRHRVDLGADRRRARRPLVPAGQERRQDARSRCSARSCGWCPGSAICWRPRARWR